MKKITLNMRKKSILIDVDSEGGVFIDHDELAALLEMDIDENQIRGILDDSDVGNNPKSE